MILEELFRILTFTIFLLFLFCPIAWLVINCFLEEIPFFIRRYRAAMKEIENYDD